MKTKVNQLLLAWGGALLGAALLRWGGTRLAAVPESAALAIALVLTPPLLMGGWIAWRWGSWHAASDNRQD